MSKIIQYPYSINKDLAKQLEIYSWWPGNPAGSNRLFDLSGYGHHGTLVYSPKWISNSFSNGPPALSFDGVNDHIYIPNCGVNGPMTFFGWIDSDGTTTAVNHGIVCSTASSAYTTDSLTLASGKVSANGISGSTTVPAGWNFIAATFTGHSGFGSTVYLYLNGILETSGAYSSIHDCVNSAIGTYINTDYQYGFKYDMCARPLANIGICSKMLSPDEIYNLYQNPYSLAWKLSAKKTFYINAESVVDTAPTVESSIPVIYPARKINKNVIQAPTYPYSINKDLAKKLKVIAWWPGNPAGSNKLFDLSGYGRHGTLLGPTWISNKFGGPALNFDGNDYVAIDGYSVEPPMTLFGWINADGTTDPIANTIIQFGSDSNYSYLGMDVYQGKARFYSFTGSIFSQVASTNTVTSGWHFITSTVAADGTANIYIDGILDGTNTLTIGNNRNITSIGVLRNADYPYGYYYNWCTRPLSNIGICQKVLSSSDVYELYKNPSILAWKPSTKKTFVMDVDIPTEPTEIVSIWRSGKSIKGTNNTPSYPYQLNKKLAQELKLAAYYPGGPMGGSQLIDFGNKRKNILLTGGIEWGYDDKGNIALDFDGSTNYAYGNTPITDFPITISCWASCANTTTYAPFIAIGQSSYSPEVFARLAFRGDLSDTFEIENSDAGGFSDFNAGTFVANKTYHIVGIIDGIGGLQLFVDGVSLGTGSTARNPSGPDRLAIGSDVQGASLADVAVGNIAIFNKVLTANEVHELYKNPHSLIWKPTAKSKLGIYTTSTGISLDIDFALLLEHVLNVNIDSILQNENILDINIDKSSQLEYVLSVIKDNGINHEHLLGIYKDSISINLERIQNLDINNNINIEAISNIITNNSVNLEYLNSIYNDSVINDEYILDRIAESLALNLEHKLSLNTDNAINLEHKLEIYKDSIKNIEHVLSLIKDISVNNEYVLSANIDSILNDEYIGSNIVVDADAIVNLEHILSVFNEQILSLEHLLLINSDSAITVEKLLDYDIDAGQNIEHIAALDTNNNINWEYLRGLNSSMESRNEYLLLLNSNSTLLVDGTGSLVSVMSDGIIPLEYISARISDNTINGETLLGINRDASGIYENCLLLNLDKSFNISHLVELANNYNVNLENLLLVERDFVKNTERLLSINTDSTLSEEWYGLLDINNGISLEHLGLIILDKQVNTEFLSGVFKDCVSINEHLLHINSDISLQVYNTSELVSNNLLNVEYSKSLFIEKSLALEYLKSLDNNADALLRYEVLSRLDVDAILPIEYVFNREDNTTFFTWVLESRNRLWVTTSRQRTLVLPTRKVVYNFNDRNEVYILPTRNKVWNLRRI